MYGGDMRIMRLAIFVLAAALCSVVGATPEQEQQEPPGPIDVWIRAGLDIDGNGRVVDLQWDRKSELHAAIARKVAPMVQDWEFVPATVNGQPAPTHTGLAIRVVVQPLEDGTARLRLANVRTGPMASSAAVSRYPVDALRAGVSAELKLTVEIEADGTPVVRDVGYESSNPSGRYRRMFLAAATESLERWTFHPEVVAGHVVRTPVTIPFTYCVDDERWCQVHAKAAARSEKPDLPPGLSMAESSAVALKTDIASTAI